jgi:glutamate dehydrogenase
MRTTPSNNETNKELNGEVVIPAVTEEEARALGFEKDLFDDFARAFERRAEDRYLHRLSPEQVKKNVAHLLRFAEQRKAGEVKVQINLVQDLGIDPNSDLVSLDTIMDDQSFIVDTLKTMFAELNVPVAHSNALLISSQRDNSGKLSSLRAEATESTTESITRFLLLRAKDPATQAKIAKECHERLTMARAAVGGYLRIKKLCRELQNEFEYLSQSFPRERESFKEAAQYLDWLLDNNFVFFGAHFFTPAPQPEQALGAAALVMPAEKMTGTASERFFRGERIAGGDLIRVRRSTIDSRIHRAGKVAKISVRRFDDAGRPAGGVVFLGLMTRKALSSQGGTIPIIRRRLDQILQSEEAIPDSYLHRAIRNAFNALPVEFLLEAPPSDLSELVIAAARAESSAAGVVNVSLDPERQSAFAFIIVSQDVFNDSLREALQAKLIESTHANYSDYRVSVGFGRAIGLYFYLTGCEFSGVSAEDIEAKILPMCTPWPGQLGRALRNKFGADTAQTLQERYGDAFPDSYQEHTTHEQAVRDIELLEQALASNDMSYDLFQESSDVAQNYVRLRLYHKGDLYLSDVLPILDHFGFKVADQDSIKVALSDGTKMAMDTFRISAGDTAQSLLDHKNRLTNALKAVFKNDCVSDPLNRLAVKPGLRWDEIDCLRGYLGYALQTRPLLAREALQRVLALRPEATRALVDLFHARFSPEDNLGRPARVEAAKAKLTKQLQSVQDATEYRVLKVFENLIEATLRTNFYRKDKKSHYVSFKIQCSKLEVVPEPRPMFEIFVHAATMEGVHLRGGKIARGGIRWSDRLDDYRTEVFGLMRTQMVKNVLIVPVGAKGGFILKNEPAGVNRRAFADKMYEILVRGLLDVTDNIIDGRQIPPPNVVAYDEFDPYLVVAADKGTAHLSDTANRVSAEYNFWLQDAFASGGSAGYDHKIYAITARGAWACVVHLFSFLGVNPEKDPIRVVGIGDLSGDVFGNGALLSSSMRLVGAFDHRHIFLDPNPDPAISFEERKRMFELATAANWSNYKKEAISAGGGVFARTEKEIPLSPEVQKMLGVTDTSLPPEAVIRRLLTLDVDLLWNGGIGTYFKSSEEDNAAVGDRVNDSLRVDAKDIRAKVVGEGGNLGFTQKGRIEYAKNGGRINTDAIDNSGGVDLSDHEVNLKILLNPMVAAGSLSIVERNQLLRDIANDVCEKVVNNNKAHALMLTLDEIRSKRDPYAFIRAVRFLDEHGLGIPPSEQVPSARDLQARGLQLGYFRPELAKISSYMKMYIFNEVLRADPLKFPDNNRLLQDYFPKVINDRYEEAIERHLLIREILATIRTSEIAEFAGITLFPDLVVEADRPAVDVALAYTMASHWLDAENLRNQILNAADIKAEARYQAIINVEEGLREATSWLLHFLPGDMLWKRAQILTKWSKAGAPSQKIAGIPDYAGAISALREYLPQFASRAWRRVEQDAAKIQELGLPENLAREVGITNQWAKAFPIAELGERTGRPIRDIAVSYLGLGQETRLNALILRIGRQPATDLWEALALRGLRASLLRILMEFVQKTLVAKADHNEVLEKHTAFMSIAEEISRAQPNPDAPVAIAVLVVVAEKLRKAVDRLHLENRSDD